MRLSMWVLADWMKPLAPRVDITQGARELSNVRFLPNSGSLSRSTVYLDADGNGNVLCTSGKDLMVVRGSDVDAVFNDILDCFEHYNDLDARLRDLVAEGADVSSLLDEAGKSLGRYYIITDATYYVQASGGDADAAAGNDALWESLDNGSMPLPAVMHVNRQQGIRTRGRETYVLDIPLISSVVAVTNLFSGNDHVGWLVSASPCDACGRGELHLQDALAPIVVQCLLANAEDDLRMDHAAALSDLLDSGPEGRELANKRLATLGWSRDDPKRIYAVRQFDPSKNPDHVVGRFLERIDPTLVVAGRDGGMYLFANMLLVDETQLEEAMAPVLAACGCAAGRSLRFVDVGDAPVCARAAEVAAEKAGPSRLVVNFDDVKLDYALSIVASGAAADIRHDAVRRLADYDREHDAQLIETLRSYLRNACAATATANELFVHRSTLLYRLERIEEVGQVDLSDPDVRFHLDLSLRLSS